MIITLTNQFHNTSVNIRVKSLPHALTDSQESRIKRELCGTTHCICGGINGQQYGPDRQQLNFGRDWENGPFYADGYARTVISERVS